MYRETHGPDSGIEVLGAGLQVSATSQVFNMLSSLVITFLPSHKHLLISWLQSPSAVISEPPK